MLPGTRGYLTTRVDGFGDGSARRCRLSADRIARRVWLRVEGLGGARGQTQAGHRDAARQQRPSNDPLQVVSGVHVAFPLGCVVMRRLVGVASAVSTARGGRYRSQQRALLDRVDAGPPRVRHKTTVAPVSTATTRRRARLGVASRARSRRDNR
jgi:hypothetical protein